MELRYLRIFAGLMAVATIFASGVRQVMAQGVGASISQADRDAAAAAIAKGQYGIELTPTQEGVKNGSSAFARLGAAAEQPSFDASPSLRGAGANPSIGLFGPNPSWGPVDLSYNGGPVIGGFTQWDVYLGCGTNNQACWGSPEQFITDLNGSRFIHLVDQYVGSKTPKRYPLSHTYIYNGSPVGTFLSMTDTLGWLHAAVTAAAKGGTPPTGYGNIYHIYLNAGIDVCADPYNSECYAPDLLYDFVFCGYHSYVNFGDYGHTLFTVEPFQQVNGCFASAPDLTSATGNVLSHEIFEAITDPDLNAWYGFGYPIPNSGMEIGDECVWRYLFPQKLGLHTYTTQNEYSNKYHSCADVP
jgi:hypothetical protein